MKTTRSDSNPANRGRILMIATIGLCLVLLAAAAVLNVSVCAEKNRMCRNYRASQRILENMNRRVIRLAVENRTLHLALNRSGQPVAIAIARDTP